MSKTLLTKLIFTHSPTPVAFSILSCIATNICLVPILVYQGGFKMLSAKQLKGFGGICVAIALDLGCQNVALAILSVALQQCIKATLPTTTVIVESIIRKKKFHWAIYVTVIAICIGPVLVASGSSWEGHSEAGSQPFGAVMMLVAMVGGAFKYVLCHKAIKDFQQEMGVLTFTFWVEAFVGLMLTPWAVLNGEAYKLAFETDNTMGGWMLLWFTGAFGGVRIIAQFYFLAKTSATSLAMSSIAMQALTIVLGIAFFGTHVTGLLALGVMVTIALSAVYAYLKTSTALEVKTKVEPEKLSEIEDRVGLTSADSAASPIHTQEPTSEDQGPELEDRDARKNPA